MPTEKPSSYEKIILGVLSTATGPLPVDEVIAHMLSVQPLIGTRVT